MPTEDLPCCAAQLVFLCHQHCRIPDGISLLYTFYPDEKFLRVENIHIVLDSLWQTRTIFNEKPFIFKQIKNNTREWHTPCSIQMPRS